MVLQWELGRDSILPSPFRDAHADGNADVHANAYDNRPIAYSHYTGPAGGLF